MDNLEQAIGYRFKNRSLLEMALSHSSYANETLRNSLKSYERLEFLGDSILGFVTADYLYHTLPETNEGSLSKIRSELVCESALCLCAQKLNIGPYIRLGHGEELNGGGRRASIIADIVESVIAAIFLDGGFEEAKAFVYRAVLKNAAESIRENRDYKSALQELVQKQPDRSLRYEIVSESGPDHDKHFSVRVLLDGISIGTGEGTSKKRAEQAAARAALENIS